MVFTTNLKQQKRENQRKWRRELGHQFGWGGYHTTLAIQQAGYQISKDNQINNHIKLEGHH